MADAIMQSSEAAAERITRAPLVTNNRSMSWITNHVASVTEKKAPVWWWVLFTLSSALAVCSVLCIGYLISTGVGVWGLNHPVGWAWDITNFVFWIGIGHAGTLISAILFLTRQKWRTSINRAAEAMTLFAVVCAGIFPLIHVGRIWMVWFLAPVPNSNAIWQNFRSPLLWDVFAVSTYFTVSILFWYTGLVPDLATLRDRAKTKLRKFFYGILALGWRGGNRQWRHYEMAYLILAGLSTPLVLSVHSVVSFDFATSVIPGWHTTIFPPYFVAGAIFGGFAMVLTIMLPARAIFGLHDLITDDHVDKMCKIIVLTGSIVGYAYAMEFFIAWYSGNSFERFVFVHNRLAAPFMSWFSWVPGIGPKLAELGANPAPYWWAYWSMIFCNVVAPQLFWSRYFRRHVIWVFIVCNFVNAGMWFERFVIIVTSLHRDFLPSSWGMFHPTWVDIWTFTGTFGIFLTLFLVFIRWLPMICIFEVKAVLPEADPHHGHDDHSHEPAALKEGAH
ncbi:MAG: polysulfide reductase NrfD [Verrucomicrobiota bacterium]|jgi:molybdopterin-containing oxidoreductase family membrane subunit